MKLAFVFPGQGSQSIGMLNELADGFALVQETFDAASDVLGYDLWQVVSGGPEDKLNDTAITQPAMLAAGVATWRVWQEKQGPQPELMAGHSLGEYTALVCAGSIGFEDAIGLVADRGRFMQQAVPAGHGAMAAILGLSDDGVRQACSDAAQGEIVSAVNFNSPGQVVIAGQTAAVERAVEAAKANGAKRALMLPVSVPSHCQLMEPAAQQLAARLKDIDITTPSIPVLNNVDVTAAQEPDHIREVLMRQLYNPVRWVETIGYMKAQGVDTLVECGPGKVLVGLNKRIDRGMNALPMYSPETLAQALAAVQ
jgi:[acyl-carrier-protein] S-malonyltransferase